MAVQSSSLSLGGEAEKRTLARHCSPGGPREDTVPRLAAAAALLACLQALPAETPKEPPKPLATVTGTIECKDATKYGPETVVEISILDVTKADAPAVTLGKQVLKDFKAFPIPFEVPYDPAAIKPGHRYVVSVRIEVSGHLAFITDTAVPVMSDGPTKDVKVPVVKVKQP